MLVIPAIDLKGGRCVRLVQGDMQRETVYAVEDLHTSYWVNFKGGIHRRGTFIEVVKDMLDDMHDWYHDKPRRVLPMGTGVGCVAVFDSLVFVHKQSRLKPMSVRIGTASL